MFKPISGILILICLLPACLIAQDSTRTTRRSIDTSLFAENNALTKSDYLVAIERTFQIFNKVPIVTGSFSGLPDLTDDLVADDTMITMIKDRLSSRDRAVNLRNLRMYSSLLGHLLTDTREYEKTLINYDGSLDSMRKEIRTIRKDTVFRSIFRDSALRLSFRPQLQELRAKRKMVDSLIKTNINLINDLKAKVATNLISIQELQHQSSFLLVSTSARIFTKERNYIWEPRPPRTTPPGAVSGFRQAFRVEKYISNYYFSKSHDQRLLQLTLGLIFFGWVFYNFHSLRKMNRIHSLEAFKLRFISRLPLLTSLLVVLSLAPLFDRNAPSIYLETVGLFLMLTLTVILWTHLPRNLFYLWCLFIILFLLYTFSRLLGLPYYMYRYWNFGINAASFALGAAVLLKSRRKWPRYKWLSLSLALYTLFQFLAVICNSFGRTTLTQLFTNTAIYTFAQTVGLFIFVSVITEAFLLQIQSSRIRKKYPEAFEHIFIERGIRRFVTIFSLLIWTIVFTSNLNLYESLSTSVRELMTDTRSIGSFSFTISGVILFLGIIWLAHFLQKYIAYFWGDTGDEASFDNKGQRSRLLITRLILLTGGFLLAIAASGLPVDKITVILGALGVGIGLGLQSIVNNFVSGIILIFDRPLRIGDMVEIGDKKGRVKEIGVRSSTILTAEGAEVIIPNGDLLSNNIINWTLSNNHVRMEMIFQLQKPFDAEIIREGVRTIIRSSPNILPLKEPEIVIYPVASGQYEMKVYCWCNDVARIEQTQCQVQDAIQSYLEEGGVMVA